MHDTVKVGIIGDYSAGSRFHIATNTALQHAADGLAITANVVWLPTPLLAGEQPDTYLQPFDAFWCAPGSPYQSMKGAIRAIRFARERGRPFFGT